MSRVLYCTGILLVLLVAEVSTQFFDFFGFQPVIHQYQTITLKPTIQQITTERTTKRNNRRKPTIKSTTAVSYESHDLERDALKNHQYSSNSKETTKRSRKTTESSILDFNLYRTSVKPARKTTKIAEISSSHYRNKHKNEYTTRNNINNGDILNYDISTRKYGNNNEKHSTSKETVVNNHAYKPISSNIADKHYTTGSNNRNGDPYSVTIFSNTDKYYNEYHPSTNRPNNNNHNYDNNNNHQSYTTKRPSYTQAHNYDISNEQSHTTKRPDYNNYDNNKQKSTTTNRPSYSQNNNEYDYNNQGIYTTKKPVYSQNNNNNYDSVNQQHYTTKYPEYNQHTTKIHSNYDNNNEYYNNYNYHTTKNPLMNRPGVKPAVVENRPPITNRPIYRPTTRKPIAVFPRPTDAGSISFPEDTDAPEVISGPDEDYMSEVEKRRYIETAERMCDKYKSVNIKQLQAIPLIPSPQPVQVNISNCAPTNVPLVVGGKVVTINEFPHMALLGWVKLENGGYSWKCGGSLISDQYVLTAAHCAYQERDNTVIIGAPRVVQLGSSYLDDPGALVVRISAVVRHPKYKSPKSYHDIALVKLVRPVQFSEVIKPACLGEPPPPEHPIIATGWGQTKFAGDQSLELRSVSLPVWDMDSCAAILGTSRKFPNGPMSDSQVCAGDRRGGKDTCQGDSGGPAQLQEGCIWRVVAVTSLGRSCGAPNTPGLYSKVQRAFIAAQVFGDHRNGNQQNHNFNKNNNNQHRHNINNQQNNNNYNKNRNNESVSHYKGIHNEEYENTNDYQKNNQYSTTGSNVNDNNQGTYNNNHRNNRQETTSNGYNRNNNEKQTTRHVYDQTNESNSRKRNHYISTGRNIDDNKNEYNNNNDNYNNNKKDNEENDNNNDNYDNNNKYYNYNTGYFDSPSWT